MTSEKRHFIRELVWVMTFLILAMGPGRAHSQSFTEPNISQYTAYPIFLTASVTPNILILVDNSGSMNEVAYGVHASTVTTAPYVCGEYYSDTISSRDWCEERLNDNANWSGSSDADLARLNQSGAEMVVGLRWQNVGIPRGATIHKAYIQFTSNNNAYSNTYLTIYGHKWGDSPQYTSGTYDNFVGADDGDLSSRQKTTALVNWHIPGNWYSNGTSSYPKGEINASDPYRTPDLKAIVQEIVDRDQWDAGNSISFMIYNGAPGTGGREAKSNTSGSGPVLYIEYEEDCEPYYGYFDPTSQYSYSSGRFYRDAGGPWSGNWLNWLSMRKIDVARKVIVGGLATSRTGGGNTRLYGESPGSGNRVYRKWYYCSNCSETPYNGNYSYKCENGYIYVYNESGSYQATYRIAVDKDEASEPTDFVDGNISGVLQKVGDKARWGNMWFYNGTGTNYEGGFISNRVGMNLTTIITDIENTPATTWTPLAESFYIAMQYFKQEAPQSGLGFKSGAVGPLNDTNDPYYESGSPIDCAKSFVIIITDGASTKDSKIPSFLKDYDNDGDRLNCDEYSCTYDSAGSDYLDDVALYARTNDLRSDLDGEQNIILYPIYAFGDNEDARSLLRDAARNGGFTDINGNSRPDLPEEWDKNNDGTPDTYYEASSGYYLEEKLLQAITDILKRASSGTAVSVLATSSEGEGTITQAYFKPAVTVVQGTTSTDITWVGYLHALWVDELGRIREDTPPRGDHPGLVLSHDQIVDFFFDPETGEAKFRRIQVDANGDPVYNDSNGNGVKDDDELYVYTAHPIEDLDAIWHAGQNLHTRSPDTRIIKTWVDLDGDQMVGASEFMDFSTSNVSSIGPFLGVKDGSVWHYLAADVTASQRQTNLIKFIRGEGDGFSGTTDMRIRTINGSVWKLSDIVHSTPVTVGSPAESYGLIYSDQSYNSYRAAQLDREQVVYVGSNDGMLHAFFMGQYVDGDNSGTSGSEKVYYTKKDTTAEDYGDELWAYVPQALLPHLKWLADPDYTHVYYVDLKPRVVDAKIFTPDAVHVGGWGTIIICGLNLGGKTIHAKDDFPEGADTVRSFSSCYFAMDVTDPHNPKLLWERTFSDIGLTTGTATVGKLGSRWYAFLGSGPTDYYGDSNQKAHIYVLDLYTGALLLNHETDDRNSFMAGPITVDYGLNYSTDMAYYGMSRDTAQGWKGSIYRVLVPKSSAGWRTPTKDDAYNTDPTSWLIEPIVEVDKPVTASAAASTDSKGNVWLYFGTGRYFADADKVDDATQYFYGIKDPLFNQRMYTDEASALAKNPTQLDIVDTSGVDVYSNKEVEGLASVSNWNGLVNYLRTRDGWKFDLGQETENLGERVLNKPTVLGGIVYDTSFVPNQDICGFSGNSNLLGFYYLTGTAFYEEAFSGGSEEETGAGGTTRTRISRKTSLGVGRASGVSVHVGEQEGATGYVQQSTGIIQDLELTPPMNIRSGLIYWRER